MIEISKNRKLNSGISLISITITIVVSIILTGAVVANLSGENNILDNAKEAKKESDRKQCLETSEMLVNSLNIELATSEGMNDGWYNLSYLKGKFKGKFDNIDASGWVYLKNNQIAKYNLYYDGFVVANMESNIQIEEFDIDTSNFIDVRDFGATGDGETDDTLAIKEAVNTLNEKGGILTFPTGSYKVSLSSKGESIIDLNTKKTICIDFCESTIILEENSYPSYNIIKTTRCNNVLVQNGNLVGDRKLHDYATVSGTHEFGYGIFFTSSQYCKAYNMNISDMTGDAIINKNGETGGQTVIDKCDLHHCRRQGISILDSDIIEVSNTKIHNIGTWDGVKGTSPMTGIDIEPDSGTKNVNSVVINNVEIKDTTSFGIVNVNEKLGEIKILNSEIYNPDITNIDIKNTKIFYDLNHGRVIKNCNLENSYIKLDEKCAILFMNTVNISNCKFEGSENVIGGRILGTNLKVNNTEFKYIRGTGDYATNSQKDFGITFSNDYKYIEGSSGNIYDNCAILLLNELNDNNSTIKNSYIYVGYGAVKLKNIKMENCKTRSNDVGSLQLNDCEIRNSGYFGNCQKYLYDTYFLIENLTVNAFRNGSSCSNSTIQVQNEMPKAAMNYIKFSNNSKVILDNYNSNKKMSNSYSTEGKDYMVEYNGTEELK